MLVFRQLLLASIWFLTLACRDSKPAAVASEDTDGVEDLGFAHSVFEKVRDGKCRPLWDMSDKGLRAAIGSPDALEATCSALAEALGASARLEDEEIQTTGDGTHYRARVIAADDQVLELSLVWDPQRTLTGMRFSPVAPTEPAPSKYDDYVTKTPLRLPFTTAWTVFWGGRSVADNYHVSYANQHFAYDLVITRDGKTHSGGGKKNTDYYCFGSEVVAAGAGKVAEVASGLPDNPPGDMDPASPTGNHVIIDHGNGEYSLYAHLMHSSLQVKAGDSVGQGDAIGRCGNSGNSSEPHLHFHLQDSPTFGAGESMPAQFLNYRVLNYRVLNHRADDVLVERGEPTRGQVISPVPPQPTGDQ